MDYDGELQQKRNKTFVNWFRGNYMSSEYLLNTGLIHVCHKSCIGHVFKVWTWMTAPDIKKFGCRTCGMSICFWIEWALPILVCIYQMNVLIKLAQIVSKVNLADKICFFFKFPIISL